MGLPKRQTAQNSRPMTAAPRSRAARQPPQPRPLASPRFVWPPCCIRSTWSCSECTTVGTVVARRFLLQRPEMFAQHCRLRDIRRMRTEGESYRSCMPRHLLDHANGMKDALIGITVITRSYSERLAGNVLYCE